eukprot:m.11584 g.11584  ORF g.11584 m.11584 type:complete len:248 (-) comp4482_c0_seq1:78-821(-)
MSMPKLSEREYREKLEREKKEAEAARAEDAKQAALQEKRERERRRNELMQGKSGSLLLKAKLAAEQADKESEARTAALERMKEEQELQRAKAAQEAETYIIKQEITTSEPSPPRKADMLQGKVNQKQSGVQREAEKRRIAMEIAIGKIYLDTSEDGKTVAKSSSSHKVLSLDVASYGFQVKKPEADSVEHFEDAYDATAVPTNNNDLDLSSLRLRQQRSNTTPSNTYIKSQLIQDKATAFLADLNNE